MFGELIKEFVGVIYILVILLASSIFVTAVIYINSIFRNLGIPTMFDESYITTLYVFLIASIIIMTVIPSIILKALK